MSGKKNRKEERNRNGKVWGAEKVNERGVEKSEERSMNGKARRAAKRNESGAEKFDEQKRGMQKHN